MYQGCSQDVDPVLPVRKQFFNNATYRLAFCVRFVLLLLCIGNFIYLVYTYAIGPPRVEVVYEDRSELEFPSVRICPMVPEGNLSRPHKVFINTQPGDDVQVPPSQITPVVYSDARGPLHCWAIDFTPFKFTKDKPGLRAHIHFNTSFNHAAPLHGITYGFFTQSEGSDSANITYGIAHYVQYGVISVSEDPSKVRSYSWTGAAIPVTDSDNPNLSILNFGADLRVAVENKFEVWNFWFVLPLLFGSFQYRLLYDLIFPEVHPPQRMVHPFLLPSNKLRRWLNGHPYETIIEQKTFNNF